MRYVLDFGAANAGQVPTFVLWDELLTLTPATPPAITEIGGGQYRFDYEGVATVVFKATCNGVELSDTVAPNQSAGARQVLDFGIVNAGGAPAFSLYVRLDTGAALAQPAITEIGQGLYYFDAVFPSGVTAITFKATCAAVEMSDVITASPVAGLSQFKTAATILNRAAVQCGLAAVADPVTSSDAQFVLLRELLTTLGEDLVSEREWTHLVRDASITTVAGQTLYDLPADYARLVDQTAWSRSSTWPMLPVSQQTDQLLKVLTSTGVVSTPFRTQGSALALTIDPGAGKVLVLKYLSRYWVMGAGSLEPDLEAPAQAADVVLFDALLMVLGLRFLWLEARGFDTSTASAAFQARLATVKGNDTAGRILSLSGPRDGFRLVDEFNLPTTGWGI